MSQTVTIRRVKHRGAPAYLGDSEGTPTWSANPDRIVRWLCDGYRFRFNQHRALRKTTAWTEDPSDPSRRIALRGESGEKILRTLGRDPVEMRDSAARLSFPHLAALPMQVIQHPARLENTEWWSAIKRRRTLRNKGVPSGAMPRFRSIKRGDMRFGIWHNGGKNATLHRTGRRSGVLTIKGQNPQGHRQSGQSPRWQITLTLRLSEDIRAYTSVEVDWARGRVTFISPPPERSDPHTGAVVGIDRGITRTAMTSDGHSFDMPDTGEAERKKKVHQRAMSRSREVARAQGRDWRKSKRRRRHRELAAAHSRKSANISHDFAHQTSHKLVRDYDFIAFEDLDVRAMTRAASGTGRSAKRGLNRGILSSAWSSLLDKTREKAERSGRHIVLVPAPYTSQRCAECGHTDRRNRDSQAAFVCIECGHADNADINAARNILAAALRGRAGPAGRECQTVGGEAAPAVPDEPQTPAPSPR